MTAPNTTNNVTVRKLADVAEGMWNKSKNAFVNASGDTMTGRLTMENVPINQIVTGTGTAATSSSSGGTTTYYPAKWNFDLGMATPSAGDQLVIKIPVAGHDYGTFMSTDNGTTYFPVAQSTGATRFTTRYPVNAYVFIVFEEYTGSGNCGQVNDCFALAGSTGRRSYTVGCWRVVNDYDSENNYDRLYTANGRFRTGTTGCYPYSLVCLDNTECYSTLVTNNPGTGTNKTVNTGGKFVFPASILYYAANNTTAAGALVSSTYSTYLAYPTVNVQYSSNHTATFTTNKPVYIECTLNGDGTWSPTSNSITQTLRTGYYYIYLGISYSTEYQLSLAPEHPLYYYDGTNLVSAEVARGDITAGTNNGELNVAGTDITVYTHPTDAGNKHIPAGGSSGQFLGYDSDGTAKWVANPNTDTKVKATAKTDNVNYKILATASASPTSGAATEAVYDTDITLNPSTNTISANVSGTAASAGKLTTARTTYVTLGTASTSTTRDWSGTTTIPVSGTLGIGNGGTGATSAAGARTNLDVYSKSETESLLNGKVVIVTVLPATGEAGTTYYVKDTSSSGVDKYDEYIWAVDAGATTESWIHVGEKSLDLSEYVNSLTTSGTGPLVKSLSKSGNALTATLGTIAIDNLSDWASSTDVTVSSVTYHTWWPVAPTSSNQVYGLSIYNGRLYRVYNNKGTYSVQNYDANTTYTNKSLGQGYGTCATEAATAAKIVTMSDYALTTGGIVTVKFTNALCASATMSINGKTAKPIYIKGAAVNNDNAATVSAGDTAYFMYDGTAYHLLGTDSAATNPIVNISRSGTTFTATRLDGSTFTFTQQDNNTTYTQAKLGQGYGTCTTAEATAAKSVTLTGYELEPNGVVAVKFTNGLCASATMSINGKTATPIYINGAAVTTTSCKEVLAGDLAFFIYDGSHYQFICTDRISKNGITGLSISGRTITYTRADGTTGTLTTQDTTYSFDGTYNASTNKAATVSTVTNAVNALDVSDITGFGAGKTLATLTETDGKIAATFQNISITKSQVSDFSHSHGNITNDGQIQSASDTAIAADDKIIVADKSNGNKLVRSSVTFDGSTTTTALTPKGTWEAFAKAEDITSAIEALDEGVVHLANKETLTGEKVLGAGYRLANTSNENAGYTIFTLPGNNYGTKYTNWDSALKDGAHFREWRFCFPTGCSFWGKVRFTIYGRYSNFNASGVLSKTINVAFNTSSCYLNVGAYDALGYNIEKEFRISDLVWNSTESRWEVILHSIKPSSDNSTVLVIVEAWASTTSPSSVTDGMAVARQITWVSGTPTIVTDTTYSNTWRNMTFNWADQPVLQSPYGNKIFDAADVIPIANGGTSATSATGAEYNILSKARTDLSANAISDTYRIPFLTTSPSTSNGVIAGYRTPLAVWNYMKDKMSSDSNVNISGNSATASAAQTGSALETAIDNKAAKPVRLTFTLPVAPSGGTSVKYVKITATGGDYRQWLCSYNGNISSHHSTWLFRSYSTGESSRDNVTLIKNGTASERQWYCAAANTWYVKFTNTATTSSYQIVFNVTAIDTSALPTLEAVDTMPDTATEITVYGVTKAEQFRTARQLAVSLSNTGTTTTFDGTANVTNIKVSGTLGVGNGGTGKASVTAGNYLVGNGSSALTEKTPAQVLSDIGAQAALSFEGTYNASTNKAATVSTVTNAIDALDAEVTSSDGKNVNVKVTETNGKVTAVNVTTDTTANVNDSVYYVVGTTDYPAWAANTAYVVGDNVMYSGQVRTCKSAHTSGSSYDSSKWNNLATPVLKGSITGITALYAGLKIAYKWPCTGGSSSTYLNINNLGNVYIRRNDGNTTTHLSINTVCFMVYDGTYWRWADYNSNDTWFVCGYCSTAAATAAKAASANNYVLTAGNVILIRFTNTNSVAGAITLNVNGQGAKPIYINGVASSATNYTLPAGIWACYYSGSYWDVRTDGGYRFKSLVIDGVHSDSYYASNLCRYYENDKHPTNVVIWTKCKWVSKSYMPVIRIYGNDYQRGGAWELRVSFYVYDDALIHTGTTSIGSFAPGVYVWKYTDTSDNTDYVAIGLTLDAEIAGNTEWYFRGFQVDVQMPSKSDWSAINRTGWTTTSNGADTTQTIIPEVGTSKCVEAPYVTLHTTVSKASKLSTARELAVSLSNTSTTTTFDGSANVTNIKVSGTLGVGSGGTGKNSVTANSYLKGNGTGALVERTYAQVRTDLNVSDGANKVEASSTNGNIKIDGTETTVYTHPSQTAYTSKGSATKVPQITTDATGHVTGITEVTISGVTPASHSHGNIANGGTLTDTAAAAAGNDYVVIRDADNAKIQTSTIKGTDVADAVSKKHAHSTLTLSTTAQAYDGTHTLALPASDPYTSARTPASHTHGNIQNGGTLQTTDVTIASGDKLVITDASDSNKVARASAAFDGSTTSKVLTQKGTFESMSSITPVQYYLPANTVSSDTFNQSEYNRYQGLTTYNGNWSALCLLYDVTEFCDGTIVNNSNEQSLFVGTIIETRTSGNVYSNLTHVAAQVGYSNPVTAGGCRMLTSDSPRCFPVILKENVDRVTDWTVGLFTFTVGSAPVPVSSSACKYAEVNCTAGQEIYVSATFYDSTLQQYKAWAFLDNSGNVLSVCSSYRYNGTLTVPENATKLIVQLAKGYADIAVCGRKLDNPKYYLAIRFTSGSSATITYYGRWYTRKTASATISARPVLAKYISNLGEHNQANLPAGYEISVNASYGVKAGSSDRLATARKLAVSLSNTGTDTSFDGSADVTNIKVSGTLPIANGGTGATTAKAAEYNINTSVSTELTGAMDDSKRIVFANITPSTSNGRIAGYRTASTVWNYFKTKFSYMTQAEEDNLITELGDL